MTRVFGLFAAAAIAALATQTLKADPPPRCSPGNSVMNGTYVMSGTGTVFGPGGGPLVFLGLVTYNGDGTGVVMSLSDNLNGSVARASSIPATFAVNRDCTGSKTVGSGPAAQHFDFVISPDGQTITFIGTDPFLVTSGTAVRIGR